MSDEPKRLDPVFVIPSERVCRGDRFRFGLALKLVQAGERVARVGWNGKGMWLVLVEPLHPAERFNHGDPVLSDDMIAKKKAREEQLGGQATVYSLGLNVPVPEDTKRAASTKGEIVTIRDWLYAASTPGSGIRALPWIGMKTADDGFVPWTASQTDLLAEDWELVSGETILPPRSP